MKTSTSSCCSGKSQISSKSSSSGSREWIHNEIIELIAIWEDLCNIRLPNYSVKHERNNYTKVLKIEWYIAVLILKYRRNSSLSFTISSANILLKALVYIQFFNQGLTHTLLFRFVFCFVVFFRKYVLYQRQTKHSLLYSLLYSFFSYHSSWRLPFYIFYMNFMKSS